MRDSISLRRDLSLFADMASVSSPSTAAVVAVDVLTGSDGASAAVAAADSPSATTVCDCAASDEAFSALASC